MNAETPIEAQKRAAAIAAVDEITDGMLVGLGTGTTAAWAISALCRRVADGLQITAVTTSDATTRAARAAGIRLIDFAGIARIDLCIDGVDEIDPMFRAIKGGGGAMLREKIVAASADRMIAIADASKTVDRLGARPVPVEVLPLAHAFVEHAVSSLGAVPTMRLSGDDVYRTDQGNIILDCRFDDISNAAALATALSAIPGLLGHGLFVGEIDNLFLGTPDGVVRSRRNQPDAR